ncbi:hypothetical protein B0H14DRAFT_1336790 [Mycena olivaceomarginata]|nr:hypothetical protein B0H14DRAFT_1336790 [Mycena olivaceomarginata]
MSAYAAQMTHASLMNYDIFGDWSPAPGPNAPLGTLCGTSSQPQSSAEAAFLQWTAAKLPASKLLLACLSTAMYSTRPILEISPRPVQFPTVRIAQLRCQVGQSVVRTRHRPRSQHLSPRLDRGVQRRRPIFRAGGVTRFISVPSYRPAHW